MGNRKTTTQLRKLLLYVLGQRPDEFGLVPDEEGFVGTKDLIRAVAEESGWGYVRRSHINELLLNGGEKSFVLKDDRIRAAEPNNAVRPVVGVLPPKTLYHCVRRKAYPVVCEKGIIAMGQPAVYLLTTQELALRIGRRRDPKPILLTVQAQRAAQAGTAFSRQGELIYIVEHVPPGFFTGPPLPKEKDGFQTPKGDVAAFPQSPPGSFALDLERSQELQRQRIRKKGLRKDVGWKKDVRRLRRKQKEPWPKGPSRGIWPFSSPLWYPSQWPACKYQIIYVAWHIFPLSIWSAGRCAITCFIAPVTTMTSQSPAMPRPLPIMWPRSLMSASSRWVDGTRWSIGLLQARRPSTSPLWPQERSKEIFRGGTSPSMPSPMTCAETSS